MTVLRTATGKAFRANGKVRTLAALPPVSGVIQGLSLTNFSNSTQNVFARQGVVFKPGDVPAGSYPVVMGNSGSTAYQWSQSATYTDGSLKNAVMHVRDAPLTTNSAWGYNLRAQAGTPPAATGLTLSSLVAAHDFKVVFSNVQQSSDGSTFTARASSLTASLATHASVSTRVTDLGGGPVAHAWKVWGMAGSDPHLKVNWYVTAWLNADGSVYSVEVCAVVAQDWWSVANKYLLSYDAALMDGATTINSFTGVQHPYGSHWAMVRTTQDANYCKAPWIGGAMPTLTYGFDRAYWRQSGVVPPFDTSLSPAQWSSSLPVFTPCRGVGDNPADVENVDGTGAHGTRGLVTGGAAVSFMRQDAFSYAWDRAAALTALHAPLHGRSNRTRTRPGEGTADTANSVISLIMGPKAASEYDFTASGLPVAVHAYRADDPSQYAGWKDGFVDAQGGSLGWSFSLPDASHLYSYAYMNYLIEGAPWMLESGVQDWCMFSIQKQIGHLFATVPLLLSKFRGGAVSSAMPTDTYNAITVWCGLGNVRGAAFAVNLLTQAAGVTPDAHEAGPYLRKLASHNADYIGTSLDYMPASQQAAGAWVELNADYRIGAPQPLRSPWQDGLLALTALQGYRATGLLAYKRLGLMVANVSVGLIQAGGYLTNAYRCNSAQLTTPQLDFSANDWMPLSAVGTGDVFVDYAAGSSVITVHHQSNEGSNDGTFDLPFAVGDLVTPTKAYGNNNVDGIVPAELNEGQAYYVVGVVAAANGSNSGQIRLSATSGGAAITFGTTQSGPVTLRLASMNVSAAASPMLLFSGDVYPFIHHGVAAMASAAGHSSAPAALTKMSSFLVNCDRSSYMPNALAV